MKYIFSFCFLFISFNSFGADSNEYFSDYFRAQIEQAKQGHAGAQYNVGMALIEAEDYPEAIEWLEQAAEQNHLEALFQLGRMYAEGLKIPQDIPEAQKLLEQAAEQGHPEAQRWLAKILSEGIGIPPNLLEARRWLEMLVEQGDPDAEQKLKELQDVEKNLCSKNF